jgi:hypothetical protein
MATLSNSDWGNTENYEAWKAAGERGKWKLPQPKEGV